MVALRNAVLVTVAAVALPACDDRTTLRPPAWRIEMAGHQAIMIGALHSTPAGMTQKLPDLPPEWPIYVEAVKSQRDDATRVFLRNAVRASDDDGPLERAARSRLKDQPGVAGLRTWALAYLTSSRYDHERGKSEGPGTEAIIDPKGIAEPLEDPGLVYDDLAGMSQTDQREYLRQALSGTASCRQDLTSGSLDEAALAACGSRPLRYLTMFLGRRNERMCLSAASAFQRGNAVIAVGAAHLFGPDSLIACLKAKGARITKFSRA